MNNLARLENVKADIAGLTGITALDASVNRGISQVSEEFVRACGGRQFAAYSGVRYYQGDNPLSTMLRLPDDLVSVTSLLVDYDWDGTYETTLTLDSDYVLYPYNASQKGEPYWGLELLFNAPSGLVYWPWHPRAVKLAGLFGYSFEKQSVGTLGAAISSTTATSLTMTANHDVQLGDTLVIDDEQFDVTAVSTNTITVTRGINGTTAATHLNGAAVSCRRYPRDVEMAVAERVVGLRWDAQGGYNTAETLIGDGGVGSGRTSRASYARWKSAVNRYSLPVVA